MDLSEKIKKFVKSMESKPSTTVDNFKLKLAFANKSTNPNPEFATNGSAAFDLRANLSDGVYLNPGERKLIPTGLFFEIPEGFELQVRPRSGLAIKQGITVLNSPGTIDSDYRGEVGVILINHDTVPHVISHGDRIAQAVLSTVTPKSMINLLRVDEIDTSTERGSGGFGSTGKQ